MNSTRFSVSLLLLLISFCSCSTPPQAADSSPTTRINPESLADQSQASPGEKRLVILGLNDIHGAITAIPAKTREIPGVQPVDYSRGGLDILSTHIKLLRQKFGSELLVLDAGDQFQGSLDSNLLEGVPMVQFYNLIRLNASTIGNHEFDFGPVGPEAPLQPGDDLRGALKARMSEANYPYVSANIVDRNTGKSPQFPNFKNHVILNVDGIRVGILGLTTEGTPVTTRAIYVKDLAFESLKKTTLREAKQLRAEGAQVIIVLAHAGLRCQPGRMTAGRAIREPNDPLGECDKDEIVRLLEAIPAHTVDAVVAGHSHQLVYHWVNNVPVIQAGTRASHYNLLYLTFDQATGKILPQKTQIDGPIPVCPKVFENTLDCDGEKPAPVAGRGDLITPHIYGESVYPDSEVERMFAPMFEKTKELKEKVVGFAARPISHTRTTESELGNIIADAVRDKLHTDFALVNAGGIRASLEQGNITYEELFRVLPFDNNLSLLTMTGKQIKTFFRIAECGYRGIFPFSGAKLRMIDFKYDAPSDDLNHDHKIDAWEVNRIKELILDDGTINGRPIVESKEYQIATIDFLVTGGDDMGWLMSQLPKDKIDLSAGPLIRDVVADYMSVHSPLNPEDHPAVDPLHPRVRLEAPAIRSHSKKARKRKHSRR